MRARVHERQARPGWIWPRRSTQRDRRSRRARARSSARGLALALPRRATRRRCGRARGSRASTASRVLNAPGTHRRGLSRRGQGAARSTTATSRSRSTPGERIAQLVIAPVAQAELVEVDDARRTTARGAGGFGSTRDAELSGDAPPVVGSSVSRYSVPPRWRAPGYVEYRLPSRRRGRTVSRCGGLRPRLFAGPSAGRR